MSVSNIPSRVFDHSRVVIVWVLLCLAGTLAFVVAQEVFT